jgi:bacterioferritin-associated ferredoxin
MLVCHCHRVSDRTIRDLARTGCRSVDAVGAECGAGTACGGCVELVEKLVRAEDLTAPRSASPSSLMLAEAALLGG